MNVPISNHDRGVSIVLPNYNHGHFLDRAVEMHVHQTYPPEEIILIDDGSADNSWAIMQNLQQKYPQIHLISHPENLGIHEAIASGLKHVSQHYVRVSSADDFIDENFLELSLSALNKHPQAALCFSDSGEYQKGQKIEHPMGLADEVLFMNPDDAQRRLHKKLFFPSSVTLVFKKTSLMNIGGFRAELGRHADWYIKHALMLTEGACYVPHCLSYHTIEGERYSDRPIVSLEERSCLHEWMRILLGMSDIALFNRFRGAAILPEYSFRMGAWLLIDPHYRDFISTRLIRRLLARTVWNNIRPMTPIRIRNFLRILLNKNNK